MQLKKLKVGKSLEIRVIRERYQLDIISKIEEVEASQIYVSLIVGQTKVFQFHNDDIVEVIYNAGGRLYRWKNVKGSIEKLNDKYVHCLKMNELGSIYNRREAYRVHLGQKTKAMLIDMKIPESVLESSTLDEPKNQIYIKKDVEVYLNDISETGLAMYAHERIPKNNFIHINLYTEEGEIEGIYEVIRMEEAVKEYGILYGLKCLKISNNITKFLFAEQRRQIQYARTKE